MTLFTFLLGWFIAGIAYLAIATLCGLWGAIVLIVAFGEGQEEGQGV